MADYAIHFLLSNLYISLLIVIIAALKRLLRNVLDSRMQYHVWFLLLGLLAVPFVPIRITLFPMAIFSRIFTWLQNFGKAAVSPAAPLIRNEALRPSFATVNRMNDFAVTVSEKTPSIVGTILCILWLSGICFMLLSTIKAMFRFHAFRKSTLPLQNRALHALYTDCLKEMHIKRNVPVRTSAFIKSPVMGGLFSPCVYLPLRLIDNYPPKDVRYMLLHELQHYKHMDALANHLANIISILYWFNPFVWHALKEMRNDREIACDSAVLKLLTKSDYEDYGYTLLNFTKESSLSPFPFTAGISGSMKQMQKRILNIATYRPASFGKKLRSALTYAVIAAFIISLSPLLSAYAADDTYSFSGNGQQILSLDLQDYFDGYDGCFVLYDSAKDMWEIYNKDAAMMRMPPASTYKIYSALFALESGVITKEQSLMPWNGMQYQYEQWNKDQTLESAMQDSVTWYFQSLDYKTGLATIHNYIQTIGYGNQRIGADVSSYWLDSTLKISPVEQVEMLQKLYDNEYPNQFAFSKENTDAIKESILLSKDSLHGQDALYGKTGTQEANGENICGWFVGYLEKEGHPYFFATNIRAEESATGPAAADITLSILGELDLWHAEIF